MSITEYRNKNGKVVMTSEPVEIVMRKVDVRPTRPIDILAQDIGIEWPPNMESKLIVAHALADFAHWMELWELQGKTLKDAIESAFEQSEFLLRECGK